MSRVVMRIVRYIMIGLMFSMAHSVWGTPIFDVIESYSGPVDGLYTYSYTVVVHSTSPENVWEFWVYPTVPFDNVSQIMDGTTVSWDYFTDESSFIQWFATDPLGSYDIQPGESLSGFSYDSTGIPGLITYEGSGAELLTGSPIGEYSPGSTYGATPIPEPGTLLLILTGLGGVSVLRRARSRRRRS